METKIKLYNEKIADGHDRLMIDNHFLLWAIDQKYSLKLSLDDTVMHCMDATYVAKFPGGDMDKVKRYIKKMARDGGYELTGISTAWNAWQAYTNHPTDKFDIRVYCNGYLVIRDMQTKLNENY